MAKERVEYIFAGETAMLRGAVNDALGIIQGFQKKVFGFMKGFITGKMWASAVKESIAYVETLNLFRVVMNDSLDVGKKFVDNMQEIYGLDPETIMRNTAIFHNLAVAVGMPMKPAEHLSLGLTKLGTDLASLFNMPVDVVMKNMASGMQGMTRAVRKYGMDIRMVALETTALTLGLKVNARTISEADRQGLRYLTMLRQAQAATGDYARTMESPANQLKVLTEQVKQFGRAIGDFFIGAVSNALPYINGLIMALRTMLTFLSALIGYKPFEYGEAGSFGGDAAEEMEDLESATGGATKRVKKLLKLLMPFDELNILKEPAAPSGGGGGGGGFSGTMDPAIQAAIEEIEYAFENVRLKANDVRDSILAFFGFTYDEGSLIWSLEVLEDSLSRITGRDVDLSGIVEPFNRLKESLGILRGQIWDGIKWGMDNVLRPLATWAFTEAFPKFMELVESGVRHVSAVIEQSKPYFAWMWDHFLQPIAEWTGGKILDALDWITEKIDGLTQTIQEHDYAVAPIFALITGYWVTLGIKALISAGKQVFAWGLAKAEAIYVTGIIIIELAKLIAKWVLMGGQALLAAGQAVTAWVMQKTQAIINTAYIVAQLAVIGAKWVWMGVVSLASAAKAAGAWVIALGPIAWIVAAAIAAVVLIIANWDTIVDFIKKLPGRISTAAKGMWEGIKNGFRTAINWIIGKWNNFKLAVTIPKNVLTTALGIAGQGFSINTPNMAYLAEGGVIRKPTVAMVGEGKYEEAVIPLGGSPQMQELISKIAAAVKGEGGGQGDMVIPIYIAGQKVDEVVIKGINRGARRVGTTRVVL